MGLLADLKLRVEGPDSLSLPKGVTDSPFSAIELNYGCSGVPIPPTRAPNPPYVGGCAGTRHGCCADGATEALGPNKQVLQHIGYYVAAYQFIIANL